MKISTLDLPKDVAYILDTLIDGAKSILGSDLIGVYLRGSLATGDFEPDRSDVDLLIVTKKPIDSAQFAALARMHTQIAQSNFTYAQRLEAAYIDRDNLRVYQPDQCFPTLSQGEGEALTWQSHSSNWLLERYTVREEGVTLFGPDPKTLIDPIPPDDLRRASASRMADWAEWVRDKDDPEWLLPLSHKAYAIETMCRAIYTVEHGEVAGKTESVRWCLETLPEPWRGLTARSQTWRWDNKVDLSVNPEVQAFILWTAAYLQDKINQA
jgi:hypothetical protein